MNQQLSSPSGFGPEGFAQLDFDNMIESKNERAIYILRSYSSEIESRIKDELKSWEVFFITSKDDFTEKTQYFSPEAVFIPFLAGELVEFQILIINLMYNSKDKRLVRPNVYIEGAGGRVRTKDFGEESSVENTIQFIMNLLPNIY